MGYGKHKIVKLLAKNLSLDNCKLAHFAHGDTQQQNEVRDKIELFAIAFSRREKLTVVCKNGASKDKSPCTSSRSFKMKSDI